ncbi:MAG TPA: hypothetical protein VG164_15475 [Trebonia sp.]|jgi:hypothetical protein|nr:hypothetical protein [Trebonia sp.]
MMAKALVAVVAVLAVVLGLHMLVMLAFTGALAIALAFAWRIDVVTMRTGWGLVRTAGAAAQ